MAQGPSSRRKAAAVRSRRRTESATTAVSPAFVYVSSSRCTGHAHNCKRIWDMSGPVSPPRGPARASSSMRQMRSLWKMRLGTPRPMAYHEEGSRARPGPQCDTQAAERRSFPRARAPGPLSDRVSNCASNKVSAPHQIGASVERPTSTVEVQKALELRTALPPENRIPHPKPFSYVPGQTDCERGEAVVGESLSARPVFGNICTPSELRIRRETGRWQSI